MVSSAEILAAFREVSNTKQLDRAELYALLQDGILAALAKKYGPNVQAEVDIDDGKGDIRIVLLKTVVDDVEDSSREISLEDARAFDDSFEVGDVHGRADRLRRVRPRRRAGGQAAHHPARSRRRAHAIRDEFATRVGDLLSGEVQQIERGKLVVMLNKFREAEAIIPYREQNHREHFHQGEPIRAVLKRVEETPKGPRLILSRGDPLFVKALFKLEVPEIQQNIVEIRAAAREVGSRTKIAVFSRDDSIDPVGACVGLKGSRVQAVVNELNGERIDIVPWSPDPERFAKLALAPAKVARVFSDPATQDDSGRRRRGSALARDRPQRPERAARVGAHRLEDRSLLEPRVDGARRRRVADLRAAAGGDRGDGRRRARRTSSGMPPATVAVLEEAGYRTLNDIIDLEREDFLKLPGIAPEEADRIMAMIDELTTEDASGDDEARRADGATLGGDSVTIDGRPSSGSGCLRLLGLGVRGRGAVVGVSRCVKRRSRTRWRSRSSPPTHRRTVWTRSCRC